MKKNKILSFAFMAVMAVVITLGLISCETKEPCEKDNFGTVIVTNYTGQVIWVDCTQEGQDYNDERMLGINQSTQYKMKPGRVTEWAIEAWDYPGGSWYTDTYYLDQCDVHDDPWTAGKGETIYKINVSVKSDVIKNR